jgi:hypothetical protein
VIASASKMPFWNMGPRGGHFGRPFCRGFVCCDAVRVQRPEMVSLQQNASI